MPAPYDRGYVDAVYAAGEFTNIDSFHLPLRFSYTVYWPSFSASNQLVIAAIVEGKLTKFKAGVDNNSLYPRFIRKTLVADDRFAKDGVKDFNYTIEKDGGWWPTNHPKIDAYLKFYKKNYAKLLSKPKKQELK